MRGAVDGRFIAFVTSPCSDSGRPIESPVNDAGAPSVIEWLRLHVDPKAADPFTWEHVILQ